MNIKNEKEIFDLYTEDSHGLREVLKTPFIQKDDGRVWASDGHILIRVSQECVSGKYETRDFGGKIPVRDCNADIPLSVSDLQDALGRCPQEPEVKVTYKVVTCPECGGEGTVEAEYLADSNNECYTLSGTCPICDGEKTIEEEVRTSTGRTVPRDGSIVRLGKGYFDWRRFETVIETCKLLGIESIRLVRTHEDGMSILELSKDIHVSLMPLYLDGKEKERKSAVSVKIKQEIIINILKEPEQ